MLLTRIFQFRQFWQSWQLCQLGQIGALLFLSAAASASPTLTLKEAVQYALEHSPGFDTARRTQTVRDLEHKLAVAKFLPSLDTKASNGLQNNFFYGGNNNLLTPNPTAPWYSSLEIALTETLYDNGESITGLAMASINRDLAEINYQKTRDSLAMDVALEFYRFSLNHSLYEVRKQQQSILEKQFKNISSQYLQGLKTKSDFVRLKGRLQRAEIDSVSAQNDIQLSRAQLWKLLGAGAKATEKPDFAPVPVDRSRKIDQQLPEQPPQFDATYDYRISQLTKDFNDKNVMLTRRKYWPQVTLGGSAGYANINYVNSGQPFWKTEQWTWSALLTLQYNIWDWGTRRHNTEIAELNRDIQENGLNQTLLDTYTQMATLMLEFGKIKKNFSLNQELLTLEEESYRNLETQYRDGKVAYLDLITGLTDLLDARVRYYTSYFEALQNLSKYRYYQGNLYESLAS